MEIELVLHCLPMSQFRFVQITLFTLHSDVKNSAAINNRYLDFIQTRGLMSLVNGKHMDNNLKKNLMYVYFGLIVNNRSNNQILVY